MLGYVVEQCSGLKIFLVGAEGCQACCGLIQGEYYTCLSWRLNWYIGRYSRQGASAICEWPWVVQADIQQYVSGSIHWEWIACRAQVDTTSAVSCDTLTMSNVYRFSRRIGFRIRYPWAGGTVRSDQDVSARRDQWWGRRTTTALSDVSRETMERGHGDKWASRWERG